MQSGWCPGIKRNTTINHGLASELPEVAFLDKYQWNTV